MRQEQYPTGCKVDHPLIKELWDKIQKLQDNEVLSTTFGPEYRYEIEKEGDIWILWEKDVYSGKKRRSWNIKDPKDIVLILVIAPEIYAQNHFSRENRHWDNWINLIGAFKVKEKNE